MDVTAVLLAAGKGTRMKSQLVKVMHAIAGKPMIGYVVDNAMKAGLSDIVVVVGYQQERIRAYFGERVQYVVQAEQLGTGHALLQAEPFIDAKQEGHVLVMLGDNPFLGPEIIRRLLEHHSRTGARATLLTAKVSNPTGFGRIVREPGSQRVLRLVEEKDATPEVRQIQEIWPGVVIFARTGLTGLLKRLDNRNAQGEYYLPQTVDLLVRDGQLVEAALLASEEEAIAPNDRIQLAEAEARIRRHILERHMLNGVTIIDPKTTFIDEEVSIEADTVIWPFTFIHGNSRIASNCKIGPGTTIVSSTVSDGARIEQSVVEESVVGPNCRIGPMAHLRPGCELAADVEVGNYAELKKAKVGQGVKCHHHTYLGDVTIGERANIGAGVITSNYNGVQKFRTDIGKEAFIGTNVNLIAPISIGEGALIAAGSTIDKQVPPGALAIERAEKVIKEGGAERLKARWQAQKEQNR